MRPAGLSIVARSHNALNILFARLPGVCRAAFFMPLSFSISRHFLILGHHVRFNDFS
jgi:hypothetical protein